MDVEERHYLETLCNKLTKSQLDDAESMHDNLQVLLEKVLDDEEVCMGHVSGLEAHMNFLLAATQMSITSASAYGQSANWPLKKFDCEEVHG